MEMFDRIAADLARQVIGKSDVVWCPLCLGEFRRDAITTGILTEEHVIPQSAGGRETTLTCKPCNDVAGHEIDSHLARKVRQDQGLSGQKRVRGKIKVNGVGAAVEFIKKPDGGLEIHAKATTAYVEAKLIEAVKLHMSGQRPLRFKMRGSVDLSKYLASIVKAAYLGLFVDRGYSYVLLPALDSIRRAIREDGSDRKRLREVVVPCNITDFGDLPEEPTRLTFETDSLGDVAACLSLVNLRNSSGAAWVVLPPGTKVNSGSWDGLGKAADALQGKSNVHLDMKDGNVTITGL
jgi:hypothetical protein